MYLLVESVYLQGILNWKNVCHSFARLRSHARLKSIVSFTPFDVCCMWNTVYARRHTLHFTVFRIATHQRSIANSPVVLCAPIFFQTDFHCFYVRLNTHRPVAMKQNATEQTVLAADGVFVCRFYVFSAVFRFLFHSLPPSLHVALHCCCRMFLFFIHIARGV